MARSFIRGLALAVAGVGVMVASGCGEKAAPSASNSQFKPAEAGDGEQGAEANGTKGQAAQPKPITVDKLDAESMPKGPPEAILEFMEQLSQYAPRGVTRDALRADAIRVRRMMMDAGDRVLAHKEATSDERVQAAEMKLSAVFDLAGLGEPKGDEELAAYCARLKKDQDPAIARMGRTVAFVMDLAKLQMAQDGDPAPVIEQLEVLLAEDDPNHKFFLLGRDAAQQLAEAGYTDAVVQILTLVGNKYKDVADKNIAQQAQQLLNQTKIVKLDFVAKLNALQDEKPDAKAAPEMIATIKTLLDEQEVGALELEVAAHAADMLERTEHYEAAGQVVDMLAAKFAAHEDEKVLEDAKKTIEKTQKRLALLGQPLDISGKTLDGKPFDSKSLAGKVVLIDLWATWCPPCLAEIPNIKKYYAAYKDKGFEVIGYNLDDDPAKVEQFFATQKMPWVTITSPEFGLVAAAPAADEETELEQALKKEPAKIGLNSPLAVHCGVRTIPFLILLDGEGKVVALHTQGKKLGVKLAELLGPIEEAPEEAPEKKEE